MQLIQFLDCCLVTHPNYSLFGFWFFKKILKQNKLVFLKTGEEEI